MREQPPELVGLGAKGRLAGLRLLLDPLEPPLDVLPVGEEQLELDRLEVGVRVGARPEAVQHRDERVGLAQPPEQLPPASRHVDHAHGGGRHLPRGHDRGDLVQPPVRDRGHADVGLVRDGRVRGDLGARARQRVEERRLARVRQAHDAGLERHGRRLAI